MLAYFAPYARVPACKNKKPNPMCHREPPSERSSLLLRNKLQVQWCDFIWVSSRTGVVVLDLALWCHLGMVHVPCTPPPPQ